MLPTSSKSLPTQPMREAITACPSPRKSVPGCAPQRSDLPLPKISSVHQYSRESGNNSVKQSNRSDCRKLRDVAQPIKIAQKGEPRSSAATWKFLIAFHSLTLKQPHDSALFIQIDAVSRGNFGKSWHGHHLSTDHDHELRTSSQPDFSNR